MARVILNACARLRLCNVQRTLLWHARHGEEAGDMIQRRRPLGKSLSINV
jgi:hypothetical protein